MGADHASWQGVRVGDGATETVGSDRYPGTVVAVRRNKSGVVTEIHVQRDDYWTVSGSGHDGSARYEFRSDENGPVKVWKRRRNGDFGQRGNWLVVGERDAYYDPHF